MDLNFTPEETAFREEVQQFLHDELPAEVRAKVLQGINLSREEMLDWHARLNRRGWLAPGWPKEYGGTGWNTIEKFIFENECYLAGAPRIVPFGLTMLGPVLIHYGNEKQKNYWLPRILNNDDWWCQGYSEPGAGSDLAGLKTTAVREGDHYLVNGQKTWTTLGHYANMIFCLVRTSNEGRKQAGISFLLIDMNSPGVEVRPIITLEGDHEVNEVFFTNVKVPVENLVGEENQGWTYAKFLLTHERTNIASIGLILTLLQRVKHIAARIQRRGKPLLDDPLFAARLARLEIELENLATTNLRTLAAAGGRSLGAQSSMLKIRSTELRQELLALLRRAIGPYAQAFVEAAQLRPDAPETVGPAKTATVTAQYFNNRKLSIYGGANEIQKNIISKLILGL